MMRTLVTLLTLGSLTGILRADDKQKYEFFEKKIRPVLVQKCYQCHSRQSKKVKGGLLLDTREGIRRGGESGHAVVPGNVDESLLLEAIRFEGLEMPPKEQLPKSVIADFETWIRSGAADPRVGKAPVIQKKIDFEKAKHFWAFQGPRQISPPANRNANWARNAVDRHVLARLEQEGIQPVGDADRKTLVRRIYFDLIGLPPTPLQRQQFLADKSPKAVENLIDRLLESPQFGERWGRHWLDVVRYAESTGMERNYTYPHAWRYRDYVIQAFNEDKPFNRFLTEQIAGDLLPFKTPDQRNRNVIATGMLSIGTKSLNERNKEKFLMDIVDDQIDVTSRAFLGLTASCARCHDHKFDPIPTTDYYALAGIFRSTDTLYGTGGGNGNRQNGRLFVLAKKPQSGQKVADAKQPAVAQNAKKKPAAKPQATPASLKKVQAKLRLARRKLVGLQKRAGITPTKRRKKGKKNKKAAKKKAVPNSSKVKIPPKLAKQIKQAQAEVRRLSQQSRRLRNKNKKGRGRRPPQRGDLAMAVRESTKIGDTQVRIRGEANDRGKTVPRGYLTISTDASAPKIKGGSGRLQLAEWMTSPSNPLTARVAVNRIWQHLFGQGMVRSVNNFGANGDRPSHPALLDHLAIRFQKEGWSFKKTIRYIMLSRTYQLASDYRDEAHRRDPENRLLWRMSVRRIDAEALRDAMLLTSGRLDLEPGKKSVVAQVGDGNIGRNLQANRFATTSTKRSVYLPIVRGIVPEMLRVFDFPEPSIIFGRRDETTVPTQALYMMNSPFVLEQSRSAADRLLKVKAEQSGDRVRLAYLHLVSRPPSREEQQRAERYIKQTYESLLDAASSNKAEAESKAWASLCQALYASAEFRYVE